MAAFIIRRLVAAVLLLGVVSMMTFAIFFLVPKLAGQTADEIALRYVGRSSDAASIQATKERLHLEDPLHTQYARFVSGIFVGSEFNYGPQTVECPAPCFGYSFRNSQPVTDLILDRIPVTLSLAAGASLLWLVGGVSIGVLSALKRGTVFDRAAMGVALAGVSLPIYFTGLLSLALFAYTWKLWPNGVNYTSFTGNPLDWAYNLVLPWITLAFLYAALYARLTRAGMLETMNEDYIRTARAKGLPERTVVVKHGMRASLTPIVTIFGLDLGLLLGGAVLTESTFSLPGLGQLVVDAVFGNDLPIVLGVVIVASTFVVLANLLVDIVYAALDPRVRL